MRQNAKPKSSKGKAVKAVPNSSKARARKRTAVSVKIDPINEEDRKPQNEPRSTVKVTAAFEIRTDMYEGYERLAKQLVRPGEHPPAVETLIARSIQHWLKREYKYEHWPREPSPNELRIVESGWFCGT